MKDYRIQLRCNNKKCTYKGFGDKMLLGFKCFRCGGKIIRKEEHENVELPDFIKTVFDKR